MDNESIKANIKAKIKKRRNTRGIANSILEAIENLPRIASVAFSRKSLAQKLAEMGAGFNPWEVNLVLRRFEKRGILKIADDAFRLTSRGLTLARLRKARKLSFRPSQ